MNIKRIIKYFIVFLIFYLSYSMVAQNRTGSGGPDKPAKKAEIKEKTLNFNSDEEPEMEDEDLFSYEQEFFQKKLYQRELPELTKKEKITWSFRLAETNIFL